MPLTVRQSDIKTLPKGFLLFVTHTGIDDDDPILLRIFRQQLSGCEWDPVGVIRGDTPLPNHPGNRTKHGSPIEIQSTPIKSGDFPAARPYFCSHQNSPHAR